MTRRQKAFISVKITYSDSDRVDIHHNLSKSDVIWLEAIPRAKVEVLEVMTSRRRYEYKAGI